MLAEERVSKSATDIEQKIVKLTWNRFQHVRNELIYRRTMLILQVDQAAHLSVQVSSQCTANI